MSKKLIAIPTQGIDARIAAGAKIGEITKCEIRPVGGWAACDLLCLHIWVNGAHGETARVPCYVGRSVRVLAFVKRFVDVWGFFPLDTWLPKGKNSIIQFRGPADTGVIWA